MKAEAVYRFAKVLKTFGIETFEDALQRGRAGRVRSEIEKIPGQASGLSYNYFLMLVGDDTAVKADRMIRGFVADAWRVPAVEARPAEEAVRAAAIALRPKFPELTPSRLDNAIWEFQRKKSTKEADERRHQTLAWVEAAKECARYKPASARE